MRKVFILLALAFAGPAEAEVVSAAANSFEVRHKAVVAADIHSTYDQIGRVGEYWSPQHSYSGKSHNMTLKLQAGGCFCETLPNGGSVEHMRVVYANPADGIRLVGGLGPLQSFAVAATMSWSLKEVAAGTEVTLDYSVAGSLRDGGQGLATAVDQVLGEQFTRLTARLAH